MNIYCDENCYHRTFIAALRLGSKWLHGKAQAALRTRSEAAPSALVLGSTPLSISSSLHELLSAAYQIALKFVETVP